MDLSSKALSEILDSAVDTGIVTLDRDGRIVSWNAGAARLLGWSESEVQGRTIAFLFDPEDVANNLPTGEIEDAVTKGRGGQEGWRYCRDGSRIWAVGELSPVRGDDGEVEGFIKIIRDRTDWKRADEALRDLNATLEQQIADRTAEIRMHEEALRQAQKMEALGQLTGGVAHDFNNLLQIILGNLDILQRRVKAEDGHLQRAVANATAGAQRAASLTQRLLAFARRQPLQPKPIHASGLVLGLAELLQRTLGEGIAVETVQGAGLWQAEADPNQLEAAILNLAVNARDAMPEGGKLTIETSNALIDHVYSAAHPEVPAGQYVLISVSDTGFGMDDDTIARAFEPFYTTKPDGKGTGLGLSQVYGFVKQSGGHVKIYSEIGHGTTVKIYLPRLVSAPVEPEDSRRAHIPQGSSGETILVVEDDEGVRSYSVESLRELGYRVIEAADGPSAISALEDAGDIHLMFTDVVLPGGVTGADIARRAKELRPDMKILFTTGYARNAIIHNGRVDRGVRLLTKPFSFADLAASVRDALDDV